MARTKKSFGLRLIFVALVVISLAVATILVVEDMMGLPYEAPEPSNIDLSEIAQLLSNDFVFDTVRDILEAHPDWAEAIAKYIMENMDISNLSMEDLMRLCQMFPNLQEYLGEFLMQQLLSGEDVPLVPEPRMSGGLTTPRIDNGEIDPAMAMTPLFSVDSTYAGGVYIRSTSWGDYDPAQRSFLDAPEFDGSTYVSSPSLYAGYAASTTVSPAYQLTFHLGSHRDYGTLVGDGPSFYYTVGGQNRTFPAATESRLWLTDDSDYSVAFYPNVDYRYADLGQYRSVAEDEARYRRYVRSSYRAVPEEMKEGLESYLEDHNLHTPEDVCSFLRNNYVYSARSMDCPAKENIVFYFLNEKKEGTCTNFASAATLLCRALGQPARFVTGYHPIVKAGNNNVVLAKDAHAWVEVYVNGIGWRRYEPTASEVFPEPDATYDPAVSLNAPYPDLGTALFTYETDYNGDVFFPDYAYGDYRMREHAFSAEEIPAADSTFSWLGVGSLMRSAGFEPALITITRDPDYQGQSMISASYAMPGYTTAVTQDKDFLPDGVFAPSSESRLTRTNDVSYTHLFYPAIDPMFVPAMLPDAGYYAFVRDAYTEIPGELDYLLEDYLRDEGLSSPEEIQRNLETYHYQTEENLSDLDPIENMLTGTHTGTHRAFVGTFVLLCRALGIPARYVEGFRHTSSGGRGTVSLKNRRAWAEVYYQGKGWIRFDLNPAEDQDVILGSAALSFQNVEYAYDGTPHSATAEDAILLPDAIDSVLLPGHRIVTELTATSQNKVDAGTYRIRGGFRIYDHWGEDVTEKYPGVILQGSALMIIAQKEATLSTNTFEREFHTEQGERFASVEGLAEGDHLDVEALEFIPIPDKVGTHDNAVLIESIHIVNAEGRDVTANYALSTQWGTVTVR